MSTYILGDLHGEFGKLNAFINKKNPSTVICAGDFGFWPNEKQYSLSKIKARDTKVLWIDGNHENIDALNKIVKGKRELIEIEGTTYCPRASTMSLPDGRTVLFMGGAASIDKNSRTPGYDWFCEEVISHKDIEALPDTNIDIVISHTCPESFLYGVLKHDARKMNDPCYSYLEYILEKYKPSLWYFGHWHHKAHGYKNGCYWRALNMASRDGFFHKLEEK